MAQAEKEHRFADGHQGLVVTCHSTESLMSPFRIIIAFCFLCRLVCVAGHRGQTCYLQLSKVSIVLLTSILALQLIVQAHFKGCKDRSWMPKGSDCSLDIKKVHRAGSPHTNRFLLLVQACFNRCRDLSGRPQGSDCRFLLHGVLKLFLFC
jgi:hypothetical protein